jgi:hypothetical protein
MLVEGNNRITLCYGETLYCTGRFVFVFSNFHWKGYIGIYREKYMIACGTLAIHANDVCEGEVLSPFCSTVKDKYDDDKGLWSGLCKH